MLAAVSIAVSRWVDVEQDGREKNGLVYELALEEEEREQK